ncbi:MAG: hypothetical protein JSV21_08025 [Nitrospirota bacterium]|nr:MAG: hypothetical protein JSV21_08025 [Nitrospirota bacterium]
MKKSSILTTAIILILTMSIIAGASGTTKPSEYGTIVINNFSQKAGLTPVVFDHWLHRAKFTCRLCHVDMLFSMRAGDTKVSAQDNMDGLFCGSCHNGNMAFDSCSKDMSDMKKCDVCHSKGKSVKKKYVFETFTAKFPKAQFGNNIDWEKAASQGLVKLVDYVEGISLERPERRMVADFTIKPKGHDVNEIIFSHKKHARWNGCEVCHPEIFAGGKKGKMKYTMDDIRKKQFCGVCHTTIAFPLEACDRCHSKKVK